MPDIIIKGNYPDNNKIECPECKCYFQYYTNEIITDITSPDEMDFLGGFGVHKWIKCPQCGCKVTLKYTFLEDEPPLHSLCNFFRNIFKKGRKDKNGND